VKRSGLRASGKSGEQAFDGVAKIACRHDAAGCGIDMPKFRSATVWTGMQTNRRGVIPDAGLT
jgi:hypothetical protein